MRSLIKALATGVALGVGCMAGYWLWDNGLEDKVDGLKDRLSKRKSEKSWP